MPFVALDSNDNRVNILEYQNPRLELSGEFRCPLCKTKMFIRGGQDVIYHFCHQSLCKSDFERHKESPEHLMFKREIAENLKKEVKEYCDAKIEFEYPIEKMKRIADIMMIFPNGWMVAHEIQLSYISIGKLDERTKDYLNEGIDIVWWLGKSANTKSNRDWCRENLGVCYTLNLS